MYIRNAVMEDVDIIMGIIKDAIIDMESEKIFQWDNIYPSKDIIINDIYGKNLYVYIDKNIIKAFIVLNESQDVEYDLVTWKCNEGKNLIIHRLCVRPQYKGNGIATKLIKYAEKFCENNNYRSIRLDSFTQNNNACKLYEKNGYEKRGIVKFRKGEFFCFEKNFYF